ncbi:MAG TPA: biotin/lipoyl-binding protein [Saprospiraceae bacterium]|nr:biotin/lipoyl-binding protein [Saprospiraceae bacterium]
MIHNEPFRVAVDGHHEFDVLPEDAVNLNLVADGEDRFHILHNGQSFHAELVDMDYAAHQYILKINGARYSLKISDHYERLVQQLGLQVGGSKKVNAVKAPMPGLVLNIMVEAGQAVQKGDPLLILEAMKMENVIKAAGEGRVKAVKVQQGVAVEKGQLLLEME